MPFLPPEPLRHICPTPTIWRPFGRSLKEGTRWQCEECDEVWIIRKRRTWKFWRVEKPKPPNPPRGKGGIATRRTS